MAEPPKLTASQAALLRLRGGRNDLRDTVELARLGHLDGMGVRITGQGRAALAAYDAEQRRAIRVEAMHECILAATAVQAAAEADGDEDDDVFDLAQERAYGAKLVLRAIADLIAKEESNG